MGAVGFGLGTGPAARLGAAASGGGSWAEGSARRREARREEAASEEWIASTRKEVAKLCEVAAKPFWQKHSWFLDQLKLLQVPHGAGMEAMRIEVRKVRRAEGGDRRDRAVHSRFFTHHDPKCCKFHCCNGIRSRAVRRRAWTFIHAFIVKKIPASMVMTHLIPISSYYLTSSRLILLSRYPM